MRSKLISGSSLRGKKEDRPKPRIYSRHSMRHKQTPISRSTTYRHTSPTDILPHVSGDDLQARAVRDNSARARARTHAYVVHIHRYIPAYTTHSPRPPPPLLHVMSPGCGLSPHASRWPGLRTSVIGRLGATLWLALWDVGSRKDLRGSGVVTTT